MKMEFTDTVYYRTRYNIFEHGRDQDNYSTIRAIYDYDDDPYIYADSVEELNEKLIEEVLKYVRLPYKLNRYGDGDNSIEFYETEIIREDMDEKDWYSKIEMADPFKSEEYKKAQAILCAAEIYKGISCSVNSKYYKDMAAEVLENDTDGYFTTEYKKLERKKARKKVSDKKAREEKRRAEYETLKEEFEGE